MDWNKVKSLYPNQWIIVEALDAFTDSNGKRAINTLVVIEQCADGFSAFQKYKEIHKKDNTREYYYLHTSRDKLDISEEMWIGIRIPNAISA